MFSGLISTTAPGKVFSSRTELADHYKSDWHKYNLKRREAGLPLLEEQEFRARWQAALALRQEKEKNIVGTDHLKNKLSKKQVQKQEQKMQKLQQLQQQHPEQQPMEEQGTTNSTTTTTMKMEEDSTENATKVISKTIPAALAASQENPEIDPLQSLFDNHFSATLEDNVEYMKQQYGFFIPDQECLIDMEGLLGYCHEKIKLGHYCLYCEKLFPTWQACQQHMISKQHTKLRYEQGYWEELDPFYDFQQEEDVGLVAGQQQSKRGGMNSAMETEGNVHGMASDANNDQTEKYDVNDDDDDEWEDMSEEDANADHEMNDSESRELYDEFEKEIARFGLDVTPLGELVFPDGRVVGHRALRRYYKQNLRTEASRSTAVIAAQRAAGERIYGGQVININQYNLKPENVQGAGKGILVPVTQDGTTGSVGGFSTLSLYRYQAAVRKQRRDDSKRERMYHKSYYGQNTNKMDKKHNRIMNGVSVAHAAR